MGEPAKMLVLDAILTTIRDENLIENTRRTGKVLLNGLKDLNKKYSGLIQNPRGRGTFCAFDMPSASLRDRYLAQMRNAGEYKQKRTIYRHYPLHSRHSNGILW